MNDFVFDTRAWQVRCEPSAREATVREDSTLLEAVHQVALPLAQSCDGVALCGFCRVRILGGAENLSPVTQAESLVLKTVRAGEDERLACCARVAGPVTVTTNYW